jgi:hypothetical protein
MSLRSHELAVETTYKQHENGASEAVFNLVPGPGTHYFKFRGSWFQVRLPNSDSPSCSKLISYRSRENEMLSSWISIPALHGKH